MKRIAFGLGIFLVLASAGYAQMDLQPAAIVSLLRSEPITVKQFRNEVEKMEKVAGRALNVSEQREVLDAMINERLVIQAAEKEKITIGESEINQQIQQLRGVLAQQLGRQPTDAEFNQAVRNEYGIDVSAFREQLKRQLVMQKYLMTKKESYFKSLEGPTDAEIRSEFELRRTEFIIPETVFFSVIQVPFGSDAASRTKARELADRLAKRIGSSPAEFDKAARESQSSNSGYQSVEEVAIPRNKEAQAQVGQDFITTAFSLNLNEISKVLEGQRGYQIIKVTSKAAMRNLELNSVIPDYFLPNVPSGTRITVRDFINYDLSRKRQIEAIGKATEELFAELRVGKPFQIFDKNLGW